MKATGGAAGGVVDKSVTPGAAVAADRESTVATAAALATDRESTVAPRRQRTAERKQIKAEKMRSIDALSLHPPDPLTKYIGTSQFKHMDTENRLVASKHVPRVIPSWPVGHSIYIDRKPTASSTASATTTQQGAAGTSPAKNPEHMAALEVQRCRDGRKLTSGSAGEQGTTAERGAEATEKQASQAEMPRKRRSHRSRRQFNERRRKREARSAANNPESMSDEEIALGEFSEVYLRAVNDYLGLGQPCAKEPALFSELHA